MDILTLLIAFGFWTPPPEGTYEWHANIPYRTGTDADKVRHTLDVYVPKGKKDFPVVMFVHGGSWKSGHKNLYAPLGLALAQDGIGCVIINYRLSPAVKHPAHIEDVAKAFAWTYDNIGKYGGSNKQLFLCGHSAGGHLVALLATDPTYLKAENRSPADIRGVAAVSGVYVIIAGLKMFESVFGNDPKICKQASPLTHANGKHPPFLIAYADQDFPLLDAMAEKMHDALKKATSPTVLIKCKDRNHYSIIVQFVYRNDPLKKAFLAFVEQNNK